MAFSKRIVARALARLARQVTAAAELPRLRDAYEVEKKALEKALKDTEALSKGKIVSAWFSLSCGNPDTGSEWKVFCRLGANAASFSKECKSIGEMDSAAAAFKAQIEKFGTELGIAETAFGTLQRYADDLNALIAKIRRLEKKAK